MMLGGVMFGAIEIVQVRSGTRITDPRTGKSMAVDDRHAVKLGNTIYVTKPMFERLREHIDSQRVTPASPKIEERV